MSKRLEVSRKRMGLRFLSSIGMLFFWGTLALDALGQEAPIPIIPPKSGGDVDSTLNLLRKPSSSEYEAEFKLFCPDPGKPYSCEIEVSRPLELNVKSNALTYTIDPKSGLIKFNFSWSAHFRLFLPVKNRFMDLRNVVITLTQGGKSKIQRVTLHPKLSPPPPDLQLKILNEPLDFKLSKKGKREFFTLRLEGAEELEKNEQIELSISTADKGLKILTDRSSQETIVKKIFTKDKTSHEVTIVFPEATPEGLAQIQISSVSYPKLTKSIDLKWKVEETRTQTDWIIVLLIAVLAFLVFFLFYQKRKNATSGHIGARTSRRKQESASSLYSDNSLASSSGTGKSYGHAGSTGEGYSDSTQERYEQKNLRNRTGPDLEIKVSPEGLYFNRVSTDPKEFKITGTSRKPLEFSIPGIKGLKIMDGRDNEVGYNKKIALSDPSRDYFDKIFKVSILNPSNYSRQLNLQFYEKNSGKPQGQRFIKIDLAEQNAQQETKPLLAPSLGEQLTEQQIARLNTRINDLERQILEIRDAKPSPAKDDFEKKFEVYAEKSSQLHREIIRQVNQAVIHLKEELRREFSAKLQPSSTQIIDASNERYKPIIIEKPESVVPPPPDPVKSSELDEKIKDVIEALEVIESRLNYGRQDELIRRAVPLFNELRTPAATGGNTISTQASGSSLKDRLAKMAGTSLQGNAASPPQPTSPAELERQFDGLVKGQILPIIEIFDKPPDAPELLFELQTLADVCGLDALKVRRNDELDGTVHEVLRRENGPSDRILRVTKRGFLYKNALAKKAEVIIGNGLL